MEPAVLVTGGAGYIGSHICKGLKKAGYHPLVLDNLSRGHEEFVKWGPLYIGNAGDKNLLKHIFETHNPIAVVHCAAYAYVPESFVYPDAYYRNNVVESLALLEMMQACSVNKIIFSSSCATYGLPLEQPIGENHPQNPINPYGRSKLAVEWVIKDFGESFGLKYGILRYFNAAGGDLEGEIGESHDPETHLIPLLLKAAMDNSEFSLFGTDFPTRDGTAVRDYIHVQDLAAGHIKALERLLESNLSFEVNLGSGRGTSIYEMIEAVEAITGKQLQIRLAPRRNGDPAILVSCTKKARMLLSWDPQCSDLQSILTSAWNWTHSNCLFES